MTRDEVMVQVLGAEMHRSCLDAFEMMEVAEDEIAKAEERWPLMSPIINDCFLTLQPHGELFRSKGDILYRKHCRELLDRIAHGGDARDPTDAELACFLAEASYQAPLEHNASALYMNVFRDLFPDNTFSDEDYLYQGTWEGAVGELRHEMTRKLRQAIQRTLPGGE